LAVMLVELSLARVIDQDTARQRGGDREEL
jgi:hypothetical protein